MAKDIDQTIYSRIKERCTDMEAEYGKRNIDFGKYEEIYFMDWQDKPDEAGMKITQSPDGANAVDGANRILTATDPKFKIKTDIPKRDEIERMCSAMWTASGKLSRVPVHYEAMLSALLYGEMVIAVNNTEDMVTYAKQAGLNLKRAERLQAMTPFYFEAWNPINGYPEFDNFGLSAYYKKSNVRVGEIKNRFGKDAMQLWTDKDWREEVELSTYYDQDYYCVWVDTMPIILVEHKLPQIPISVTITEGSTRLFNQPERQRRPLLYKVLKSKLWERQNLALSVFYTKLFEIGINPLFIHTRPPGMDDKQLDLDVNAGVLHLEQGESFAPLGNKGVLDPSVQEGLGMAEKLTAESTIYKQTLGSPIAGTDTYSTISLLSQSGRQPLISPQKRGAWGIAEAMEIALNWYRESGSKHSEFDVKPGDIPKRYELEVKLDVDLPQDKLQMANIASIMVKQGIISKEFARENFANIDDNEGMVESIWSEQAADMMFGLFMQEKAQQAQQKAMMAQQQQQMAMQPQGQPPQGMPPEMMQGGPQPGMPVEGMPMQGGLPQNMGGMIPGQGGGMPPEQEMMG